MNACVCMCVCGYVGTGLQEGKGDELMQRLTETRVGGGVCGCMYVCVGASVCVYACVVM